MNPKLSRVLDWSLYAGVAALALLFVTRKFSGPSEGKPAAAFDLPVVDKPGERFRLAEHRGKPVLVEVFASWCGACKRAAPALRQAWERHGKENVAFVAISIDGTSEELTAIKREWGIPYEVVLDDGSISKKYGIEVLPTFVLVDSEGVVRHVATGAPSGSDIDEWIREL